MDYKMGMRFVLFFTVWETGYLLNCLFYKLQGLRKRKIDKFIVGKEIWMKKSCEVSNYGKLSAIVGYCKNRDY